MNNWAWGWDALVSIGQILGVAVTVFAVIVALKPRMRNIKVLTKHNENAFTFSIQACNLSCLPNAIAEAGFCEMHLLKLKPLLHPIREDMYNSELPIIIDPYSKVLVSCASDIQFMKILVAPKIQHRKNKDKLKFSIYLKDSDGKIYFSNEKLTAEAWINLLANKTKDGE